MNSKRFEDVEVWRKAHAWVLCIYKFTEGFPKHELFGLTSQLRRAAVSVPANFAEVFKKRGLADKIRIYNIAQGSLEEEISKMLESYARAIRARQSVDY
jgi:four helix bundle protein